MKHWLLLISLLLTALPSEAQRVLSATSAEDGIAAGQYYDEEGKPRKDRHERDSVQTVGVPIGIHCWQVDPRFGRIRPAEMDTLSHAFQNDAFTSGREGEYNYTANLGAPRIARRFMLRDERQLENTFIFARPYDFFLPTVENFRFSNTKSPYTSLTYHECGNKTNGEDRITARFYVNAGKRLGMGFFLDYLYGRGYYESQQTAHFNTGLYASYLSDHYQLHAFYTHSHLKNAENGGIESDDYVMRPEAYPTSYGTADIPTNLKKAWQKMGLGTFFLTHSYAIGRYVDDPTQPRRPAPPTPSRADSIASRADSIASRADRIRSRGGELPPPLSVDSIPAQRFLPVTSIIHTLTLHHNQRRFVQNGGYSADADGYFADFYLPLDSANDLTRQLSVSNTLAIELSEGLNRWVPMGLRLFARHRLEHFTLPTLLGTRQADDEHLLAVGAEIFRQQGRRLTYSALGEYVMSHHEWGQFNVEAQAKLALPLRRDTLSLALDGYVRRETPSYYYRHYHARNAWWDNENLDGTFRARVGATLQYAPFALSAGIETIQKYAYFAETLTPYGTDGNYFAHSVAARQTSRNITLLDLTLRAAHAFGPLNLEGRLTYQQTTDKTLYPLPQLDAYANVYLLFRIKKVLRTELGGDVRWFSKYYAPAYSPILLQYVQQDPDHAIKTGAYPIVNVYANFHIQRTRFYVMASHVNFKTGSGNPFLVPHYPLNRLIFRIGISWNFIN